MRELYWVRLFQNGPGAENLTREKNLSLNYELLALTEHTFHVGTCKINIRRINNISMSPLAGLYVLRTSFCMDCEHVECKSLVKWPHLFKLNSNSLTLCIFICFS
jgi:hypothetical protein